MGGDNPSGQGRFDRGPSGGQCAGADLTSQLEWTLREHWWRAVATVTRLTGDLGLAEDAVRDACTAALAEWRVDGIPSYPLGWLVGVARHKAIDALRREGRRAERETAAIAACHSCTDTPGRTDWRKIAVLYGDLMRYEPTVVFEANRAVAVATSEGPAAGLVILDAVAHHPQLARWPHLHLARADLLRRLGRHEEAIDAYRNALQLEPSGPEQAFIQKRLRDLDAR